MSELADAVREAATRLRQVEADPLTPTMNLIHARMDLQRAQRAHNTELQRLTYERQVAQARRHAQSYLERCSNEILEQARYRITQGDVTRTQYGWRVALRHEPEYGCMDDRSQSGAKAYWPETTIWSDAVCRCWRSHQGLECAHTAAVYLMELDPTRSLNV